jgi:hypothetical protein
MMALFLLFPASADAQLSGLLVSIDVPTADIAKSLVLDHGVVAFTDVAPRTTAPIDGIVDRLSAHPHLHLQLAGAAERHERRTPEGRAKLGLRRAAKVRRAVIARGVDPRRVSITYDAAELRAEVAFRISSAEPTQ